MCDRDGCLLSGEGSWSSTGSLYKRKTITEGATSAIAQSETAQPSGCARAAVRPHLKPTSLRPDDWLHRTRRQATTCAVKQFTTPDRAPPPAASRLDTARPTTWTTGNDSSRAAPCNRASRDCRAPLPDSRHTTGAEWPTTVADGQDDWRLTKNTPQDRLEVNAHSTPQWNYTPEGVLASSPQVGLGGAGLGLRSSELYLMHK